MSSVLKSSISVNVFTLQNSSSKITNTTKWLSSTNLRSLKSETSLFTHTLLSIKPEVIFFIFLSAKSDRLYDVWSVDENNKQTRLTQTNPSIKLNSKNEETRKNPNNKKIKKSDKFLMFFSATTRVYFLLKTASKILPKSSGKTGKKLNKKSDQFTIKTSYKKV